MYIKHLELTRFKSFGHTTGIPLLPGFTVVSGPNGSGKSNILDALLFALGLASSKGMRAERLPDLVNQAHLKKGRTAEAQVKVTFALDHTQEWTVTRKLRVTQQGTYTSNYYINDGPCTLSELHEQLSKFHIYPEGYNIVLQGDVTGIISMNSRDRRAIIDELAGVGEFDRKIHTAKEKLEEVKLQEEKYRLVEQELQAVQERLKHDRAKAEKYQSLRCELTVLETWAVVIHYRELQAQVQHIQAQQTHLEEELGELAREITAKQIALRELQQQLQALGEEEFVALTQAIAEHQAEHKNLERQQQETERNLRVHQEQITHLQTESDRLTYQIDTWQKQLANIDADLANLEQIYHTQHRQVELDRAQLQTLSTSAQAYIQHQRVLFQEVAALQSQIEPLKGELTRLRESLRQWQMQLAEVHMELSHLPDGSVLQQQQQEQALLLHHWEQQMQELAQTLSHAQAQKQLHQATSDRLWQEQRTRSRQLDKLEAQQQAKKEVQGTRAVQVILQANLDGVYGVVAQLGRVQPQHQLALEIAAGNRLGFIVVENDEIASQGIQLLKQERAGRATFLPLNKLKKFFSLNPQQARIMGAIDYAVNLVEYAPEFHDVFGFVFGNTLVFPDLHRARPYLGQHRMVTLEGELLETTGAMSGGSMPQREGLRFGIAETQQDEEIENLRQRLADIETTLQRLQLEIQALQEQISHHEQELHRVRGQHTNAQRTLDRLQTELNTIEQVRSKLTAQQQKLQQSIDLGTAQQTTLQTALAELTQALAQKQAELQALEADTVHSAWQTLQETSTRHQQELQQTITQRQHQQQQRHELINRCQLAEAQIQQIKERLSLLHQEQARLDTAQQQLEQQISASHARALLLEAQKTALHSQLAQVKAQRDVDDRSLRALLQQQHTKQWELEKLQQTAHTLEQEINQLTPQLQELDLSQPIPDLSLAEIQHRQQQIQKKLQALEPVNMLAIAEYDSTTARLEELSQKLTTLALERSELLLRIENFTTLRQRSFMEAFNAVNQNFQQIFAELSDGDGYLQLENPQDPLSAGLNLVAHPKGKPVQHLASMSGGEKSLTALSFIFALQRYRPSPFYAFDEVDMFLDGANVERLAQMLRKQAQLAQFIVVSLRRPMIEAADRTIGVTQARGAFTQVIGFERHQPA